MLSVGLRCANNKEVDPSCSRSVSGREIVLLVDGDAVVLILEVEEDDCEVDDDDTEGEGKDAARGMGETFKRILRAKDATTRSS